ncbi:MAG: DNA topoisomerase IV subunit B [Gammaproteobacteria bacterium]|nr:DNA topoisomerase IV subunit B [Gammaproteobacteria bacterium]MDX2488479.1 DNA topoisomerase IV subunit B [Gammaproteobacteria bacterium]
MSSAYDASSIEVLTGLEPVRKRPGMYTQTERPNHLVQEVVDNSVDEAIAGFCNEIRIVLLRDGSVSVADNGRGMPVDTHQREGVSGVEVILTRLHAGGKFSNKNYRFSGGLHGVGVSVVNALSGKLEVRIRRNGVEYQQFYADGKKQSDLKQIGKVGKNNSGTLIHFWPDPQFFDSVKFSVSRLKHVLRAKAVLCPGLKISLMLEADPDQNESWLYEDGLRDYLLDELGESPVVPAELFLGKFRDDDKEAEWVVAWLPEAGELVTESYVNLIPTSLGGTHTNGLRSGLTDAVREFCEFRNLLPRGIKLSPDDVWARCSYVLSLHMTEPQFSGQTKERLSSRDAAGFVSVAIKDAFSLWLNHNTAEAEIIVQLAISNAIARQRAGKKVQRKKLTSGPALPGKLADCVVQDLEVTELFLVEGDSAGGSAKQARNRKTQAILPLRGKILNTWEVDSTVVLGSQEVHDIAVALGLDPGSDKLTNLRYGKVCILADADSDGLHIATLLCALFLRHFQALVEAGRVYVAMPPLYRIDVGKEVRYALDDEEKETVLQQLKDDGLRGKVNVQRFKGLGEMNPLQLRETTMDPDTRRLVRLEFIPGDKTFNVMDMLLAKRRSGDRKLWLSEKGDEAELGV